MVFRLQAHCSLGAFALAAHSFWHVLPSDIQVWPLLVIQNLAQMAPPQEPFRNHRGARRLPAPLLPLWHLVYLSVGLLTVTAPLACELHQGRDPGCGHSAACSAWRRGDTQQMFVEGLKGIRTQLHVTPEPEVSVSPRTCSAPRFPHHTPARSHMVAVGQGVSTGVLRLRMRLPWAPGDQLSHCCCPDLDLNLGSALTSCP